MNETRIDTVLTLKKIAFIGLITILLIIPLRMIKGIINERESLKYSVKQEISKAISESQIVDGPQFIYWLEKEQIVDDKKETIEELHAVNPHKLDSKVSVSTESLHRSIYDVIVYHSKMDMRGHFILPDGAYKGKNFRIKMKVSDLKGLTDTPQITLLGKDYTFDVDDSGRLYTNIELPKENETDGIIPFTIRFELKGTERLMFAPSADETILSISSPYPNPSFVGEYLPLSRDVNENGFTATWKVLKINKKSSGYMGVDFMEMANQYQQAMRSAKYGMLIICLVFIAGLLVEFVTRKQIHIVQYALIGLSLALFYSLLTAFSDIIPFGWSYLIASTMTTLALTLYYRGILRHKSAWVLGGFISVMYVTNYILLQMETHSLLAGSLLLFVLLSVMMYYTSNINKMRE